VRSGTAPITISARYKDKEATADALAQIERACRVSLSVYTGILLASHKYFSLPAPLLTHFSLIGHVTYGYSYYRLPDDFLGSRAPRLRSLHLANVAVHVAALSSNPVIQHLTELRLESLPRETLRGYDQFLTLVARMPSLETLRLHGCFAPVNPSSPAPSVGTVHVALPRLSSLSLVGAMAPISEFCRHLRAEPGAIKLNVYLLGGGDLSGFLTFLDRHITSVSSMHHDDGGGAVHLRAFPAFGDGDQPIADIRVALTSLQALPDSRPPVSAIYDIVSRAGAASLTVGDDRSGTAAELVGGCDSISSLSVTDTTECMKLFDLLAEHPSDASKRHRFPYLAQIRLRIIDWDGHECSDVCQKLKGLFVHRHEALGVMPSIVVEGTDGLDTEWLDALGRPRCTGDRW
jgi:hypothetical protein